MTIAFASRYLAALVDFDPATAGSIGFGTPATTLAVTIANS
jgi:hypothetical protein